MALVPQLASATEDRAAGGQRIDGSVHFDQDKTTYLAKTFATAGNTRTWTWSCWIQRTYFDDSGEFSRIFGQSEVNHIYFYNDGLFWDMGSGSPTLRTTQKFRDNDWFNIVAVFDSTDGTSGDRMRLYVNGVRLTLFDSASYPGSNATTSISSAAIHTIGNRTSDQGSAGGALSANMSQVYFVDGQALEPSEFGYTDELTGQWRPKKFSGSYDIPVSSATGAKPILVTTGPTGSSTDGSVDTTDSAKASIKIALPLQDDTNDVHHLIKGSGSAVTVTALNAAYTTTSKYYGGAGDFTDTTDDFSMQVSNSDGHFDIGTGDCCIEWWAYYPSTVSMNGYIFRSDTTNGDECYAYAHSSGTVAVKFAGFTWDAWPGSGGSHDDFSNCVWNHFCIERNGSTWTAYMNGVPMRTTSNGVDANPGDTMGIGNYDNSTTYYHARCYLQDFRWYTASKYGGNSFSPPALGTNSFYLPLDGSAPIGQDQSGIKNVNDGTKWSDYVTWTNSTGFGSVKTDQASNMFDGDDATAAQLQGCSNPNTIIFTPPGGIDYLDKVEAYIGNSTCTVSVNGGSFNSISAGWNTIATGSGTLTSISVRRAATNGAGASGFKIDGIYLLDGVSGNSWTPVKFGGTASVDKATGAFPILNTTQGGTVATPGARGSIGVGVSVYNSKYYLDGEEAKTVKFIPGQTVTFDTSDTTVGGHPFRLSGTSNGSHNAFYGVDFDGTGDYLSIPSHSDYMPGTNDFTLECYAKFDSFPTWSGVAGVWNFTTGRRSYEMYVNNGVVKWYINDGDGSSGGTPSNTKFVVGPLLETGKWYHLAGVRKGSIIYLFVDGVLQGTENIGSTIHNNTTDPFLIGMGENESATEFVDGIISNVRFVNGTALYTTDFSPEATTLANVTNTKLLCCGTGSAATDATVIATGSITAAGDAAISNTNPFDEFVYGTVVGAISEGTVGAATTITIPSNAPSDLYYYCTNHSGMGGSVSIGATDISVADPYAWKCVLAVPGNYKPDFDQSDKVNCTTPKKSCYEVGLAPNRYRSLYYGNSIYFDNSNDYGEFTGTTEWDFGTGNYTAEAWFYSTDQGDQYIAATLVSSSWWGLNVWSNGGSNNTVRAGYNSKHEVTLQWQNDRWYHIAVSREDGTSRLFLDGVMIDSQADTDDINASTTLQIGRDANSWGLYYGGYIQELKVYKGISKYNKDFIPASPLPDILPETPSGVAYESLLLEPSNKVKGMSVDFDGASFLRIPAHADYQFSSGDYNVEMWVYPTHLQSNRCLFDLRSATGSTQNGFSIVTDGDGQVSTYSGGGYLIQSGSNGRLTNFRWSHILISHVSGTQYMFIDGKLMGTTTTGYSYTEGRLSIGADANDSPSEYWKGKISNVRVIKGSGLYTADFTPPTEPLTTTSQGATASEVKFLGCNSAASPTLANPSAKIAGVNDGRSWSQGVSCDGGFWSTYSKYSIFNTLTSDAGRAEARKSDTPINIDFIPAVSVSTHLKIWSGKSSTRYQINDSGSYTTYSDAVGAWKTIHSGSLTLSNLKIMHGSAGNAAGISAIDIDSTTLVDPIPGHRDVEVSDDNPYDKNIHTVRGQEAQYATLSPVNTMNTNATFSDGNLQAQVTGPCTIASSIPMFRGKWYCEIINTAHGSTHTGMGIAKIECCDGARQPDESQHRGGWAVWHISGDGSYHKIGYGASWGSQSTTWEDWGDTWGTNGHYDVMGMALDMDNRTLEYYKNGENMGTYENSISRTIYWGDWIDAANDNGTILPNTSWADGDHGMVFVIGNGQSGATSDFECNFGQKPWKFPPPPGYQAATTANCYPRPTLVRPDQYFGATTYTGNGGTQSIDVGHKPDLVWIKNRDVAEHHGLFDTIRGPLMRITSDYNYASTSRANTLTSFDNKGFSVGSAGEYNGDTNKIVAWTWKAGGNKGTWNVDGEDRGSASAAGLTAGDTSVLNACSINTKAGFSIVKWTQDSAGSSKNIAHGLSKAPSFVIMKHINNTSNWYVVHTAIENEGKIMYLNTNSDQDTSSDFGGAWPGATYTATSTTGVDGREVIMYSWTNTKGVQWFGQYEGNGDASKGVYVELGFKPAMIIIKRVDSDQHWRMWDNARSVYNPRERILYPNDAGVEGDNATYGIDFLEQGFKMYNSENGINTGGSKFSYCAWAETPTSVMYGS